MNQQKILLFIPMYNCEKQIVRVLQQLIPSIGKYIDEVIVVDNGSTDQSREKAQEIINNQNIDGRVVLNNENYSLGGSHKVTFNYAIENGFDYVIVLHGDDQADIKDLLPYLESGEFSKYDSFLGSRFHPKSKLIGYSRFKIFGNHIVNWFCSIFVGKKISDMGSGLNMYKVSFLKPKFYLPFDNNLTFNIYMLFWSIKNKSSIKYFPITWKEEDQVSNAKVFKQAFQILSMAVKMPVSSNKVFVKENKFSKIDYGFKKIA